MLLSIWPHSHKYFGAKVSGGYQILLKCAQNLKLMKGGPHWARMGRENENTRSLENWTVFEMSHTKPIVQVFLLKLCQH